MVATVPLFRARDGQIEPFFVPTFRVEVGVSPDNFQVIYDVTRVSYKDAINQIDTFDLTLSNGDWGVNAIRHAGTPAGVKGGLPIAPGQYARLWLGYETKLGLYPMLTGRIVSISPSFGDSGLTLTVRALSSLEALRAKSQEYRWRPDSGKTEITDKEIATKIIRRSGATPVLPRGLDEAGEPSIMQANETDISFLISRAKRRGYIVCFRETVPQPVAATGPGPRQVGGKSQQFIYFGPSNLLQDVERRQMGERTERFELRWGASLIDFRPTLNLSTTLWSKVTMQFWNRRNRSNPPLEYTLDQLWNDEHGLNRDLSTIIRAAELGVQKVSGIPVHTEGQAKNLLRNTLRENFLQLLTAEGTAVGHPELRACSRVQLTGVGPPFDGAYFLTGTTHSIDDSGYRTQFNARREQVSEG